MFSIYFYRIGATVSLSLCFHEPLLLAFLQDFLSLTSGTQKGKATSPGPVKLLSGTSTQVSRAAVNEMFF